MSHAATYPDSLQRSAELEYLLLGDLRDLLEEPPTEETKKWLAVVLDALLDTCGSRCAGKSYDVYYEDLLDEFPSWDREVERLRSEYADVYERLRELQAMISGNCTHEFLAGPLSDRIREWMTALAACHRHENRLVQTAVNLVVGGGD